MTLAKYDPDRDANGHFKRGNIAARGHNSETAERYRQVVAKWWDMVTPEDARNVHDEHMWLITQRDDIDNKLRAVALWYDRVLGKAVDRVAVDVRSENLNLNASRLDADDMNQLQKLILKAVDSGDVVEAEVVDPSSSAV